MPRAARREIRRGLGKGRDGRGRRVCKKMGRREEGAERGGVVVERREEE